MAVVHLFNCFDLNYRWLVRNYYLAFCVLLLLDRGYYSLDRDYYLGVSREK